MYLDAHQHFWYYNPEEHVWMTEDMDVLKHDFLQDDLTPLLQGTGFDGTIVVQARQTLEETEWLLELSDRYEQIKGVVGWVDLRSPEISAQLEKYSKHPKLKGVRHVVHDEPDDHFMLLPEFQRGIAALKEFNLTYDLLLFPKHLPIALQLVEQFPEQPFVIDHISKPFIKDGLISPWKEDMITIAQHSNVFCKISGMVTEANWKQWKTDDFTPYLDTVFEAFGVDRLMIGSDWPVCTLCGNYATVLNIVRDYLQQFPVETREKILGGNCAKFYHITE